MAASRDPSPYLFQHVSLPAEFLAPTQLLDLRPRPLSVLHNKELEFIYSSAIDEFNKIQTQVFQALYATHDVFVGAPTGSGKTICAEFALLRLWTKLGAPRALRIEPFQDMVNQRVAKWQARFGSLQNEKGDVIVCTPTQWNVLSRRWKQRKDVQNIGLLIADKIQLVGGEIGPTYEVVISRTRYVSAQTEIKTRIVACGVPLANPRYLGEWTGVPSHAVFNFPPSASACSLDIEESGLQRHLDHDTDRELPENMQQEVAIHHEALNK